MRRNTDEKSTEAWNIQFLKLFISLEAFSVDYGWAGFIVFLLGDPHLLEGGERSQDGASDPYRVLSLWWSNDFDLHCWWSQCCNFFLHTISNTWKIKLSLSYIIKKSSSFFRLVSSYFPLADVQEKCFSLFRSHVPKKL